MGASMRVEHGDFDLRCLPLISQKNQSNISSENCSMALVALFFCFLDQKALELPCHICHVQYYIILNEMMMNGTRKKDLTTASVAKILGVAVGTVQKMVDQGLLDAWKTGGGHRRITHESVERYLQSAHSDDAAQSTAPNAQTTLNQISILIVEDSHYFSELLRTMVTAEVSTADIKLAHDAFEAFGLVRQQIPDLLLLDIGLPGMDGISLLQKLMSLIPNIVERTIIVTGEENFSQEKLPTQFSKIKVINKNDMADTFSPALRSFHLNSG